MLVQVVVYGGLFLSLLGFGGYCVVMPGDARPAKLRGDPSLEQLSLQLRIHVLTLAGEIGERNLGAPGRLKQATDYLTLSLARACRGAVRHEPVQTAAGVAQNLYCDLPAEVQGPVVIVGAHYDTAEGTPGANDNASGSAVLIELCRRLALHKQHLPIRCALFANEEPPYFKTEAMGSLVHARGVNTRGEEVRAMLALESLGTFSGKPGSQRYPSPLSLVYPSRGDFVAFVSNLQNRSLVAESLSAFRNAGYLPSEGAALPQALPGVDWSDHWAFYELGYPALMVTDTATFRDEHYHRATDTPEHLDYEKMARALLGVEQVVRTLASTN